MNFKRFKSFSLDLRKELLQNMGMRRVHPLTIGKNRTEIIQDFKKLKEQETSYLYF